MENLAKLREISPKFENIWAPFGNQIFLVYLCFWALYERGTDADRTLLATPLLKIFAGPGKKQ